MTLGVETEGSELRRSEQLYKRALEADPALVEARIRLGRVLGLRGRHEEAVAQLQQGLSATETLLQYHAHLFLAAELDALGNGLRLAGRMNERPRCIQPRSHRCWASAGWPLSWEIGRRRGRRSGAC